MKKKFMIALLVMMGISSFAYAYLTSKDQAINSLSIGYNTTEITEIFPDDTFDLEGKLIKVVQVENKENVDCYVRVMAKLSEEELADDLEIDFNTEDWSMQGDYYYYNSVLEAGDTTSPLFTQVIQKNDEIGDFDILIYEESVQAEHYENAYEAFEAIGGIQ